MVSPAFESFFEVFSEGVVLTVALVTSVSFAERSWKRSAPLNVTGLGASLIAVFYSLYGELGTPRSNIFLATGSRGGRVPGVLRRAACRNGFCLLTGVWTLEYWRCGDRAAQVVIS